MEEKILVGQADYQTLTDDQKKDFGKCFANPTQGSCGQLLVQEFDYSINEVSNVATLTKRISDGSIAGRDANGYYSGKKDEVRHISLSNLEMVSAPTGKGLFDVWDNTDWQSFADASGNALNDLYKNLSKDSTAIGNATASIRKTEAANDKAFQERKANQEKNDSLIQELALAYFTGGAAGVQASIKGKIEDHINTELAKAWIAATGGSEEDIQMASQVMQFMRGRMEMRDMKSDNSYLSFKNPLDFLNPVKFWGQVANVGLEQLGKAYSGSINILNNITGGTSNMVLGLFHSASGVMWNTLVGNENYSNFVENATAKEKKFAQLKAQEESLAKSAASQGIASATGLPPDLVSSWVNDKVGERKAEKANKFAGNAIMDVATQIVGVVGGLVKTVLVAGGVKEREIQKTLAQGNDLANIGILEPSSAHMASLGLNEQLFGMKATGTSYQSSVIDINNKDAVQEELGKLAIANHIAATMGVDPSIAKGFVDKGYADHQQRINDRKAQAAAIEQVAVTALTTAITLGAGAALSAMVSSANATISAIGTAIVNFGNTVGSAVTGFFGSAAQATTATVTNAMGAAVNVGSTAVNTISAMANAMVQGAIGSKNGIDGALAGIANGLLGGVTQLAGPFQSGMLKGITPGLGVTYSPDNGWGGSIGLGNSTQNASISFSRHGDTTVQGSYRLGESGAQLTGDVTTNGAVNIGIDYNQDKGPRKDWNFSLMYDMAGTGLSGSIGYTDPRSTLGLTSTFNRDGMSTSAELTGVSIATNGPNGFQMDEINFAEQNINAAQDQSQGNRNILSGLLAFVDQSINDLTGEKFLGAGNAIRNSELGRNWPFVSNVIASPLDIATGLVKMGTEVGTLPIQILAHPERLTSEGYPLPGFRDGLGTFTIGAMGILGSANHALTSLRAFGTEIVGSSLDIGKSLFTGLLQTGKLGLAALSETIVAPLKMASNFMNGNQLNHGMYSFTSSAWNDVKDVGVDLKKAVMRMGNVSDIISGKPAVDPKFFSMDKAAVMSTITYGDLDSVRKEELMKKEGIKEVSGLGKSDPDTGFKYNVYTYKDDNGKTVYALAFAGTEDGKDWKANFSALIGQSSQHTLALQAYNDLQKYINSDPNRAGEIVLTGHSLGGGLAATVAHHFNKPAITFNAAGTNFTTNGVQNALNANWDRIDSYSINTDPLTIFQNTIGLPIGTGQSGRPHTISASNINAAINGHSIYSFLD